MALYGESSRSEIIEAFRCSNLCIVTLVGPSERDDRSLLDLWFVARHFFLLFLSFCPCIELD